MLICQKCGYDNELGRIFCHGCGTKLDLDSMKPPKVLQNKGRSAGPGRVVRRVMDVALLLAAVGIVYLLWQVAEMPPAQPNSEALVSLDRKRMELDTAETTGQARTMALTEDEVNAYFAGLSFGKAEGKGIELVPVRIHAVLGEGVVTIMLLDRLQLGSSFHKMLSFTFMGRATVRDGEFRFESSGGALGRLPLHPQIVSTVSFTERFLGGTLRNLGRDKQLLDKLRSVVVEPGKVTLRYAPAAAGH